MTVARAGADLSAHRRDSHPPGSPCPACAALGSRVMELELRYMELQHELHELSGVVRAQADQIDQLERRLDQSLAESEDQEEA